MSSNQSATSTASSMRRPARALESGATGTVVTVEICNPSSCARCAKGQGCGAGIFNRGNAPVRLSCLAECPVTVGEELVVEFEDAGPHWLWLVCGAYGLPTTGLIVATVIMALCFPGGSSLPSTAEWFRDLILAAAALGGLAGGVFAWRMMAPSVLLHLEKQLSLQTGRIVAAKAVPTDTVALPRSLCPTPENP